MRMWKVPTEILCDKHLLGEHVEMHMFVGCIKRAKSIRGFINKGLVEVDQIVNRHNELAEEMTKRGMNHKSPIHDHVGSLISVAFHHIENGHVDIGVSTAELMKRCSNCRARIAEFYNG